MGSSDLAGQLLARVFPLDWERADARSAAERVGLRVWLLGSYRIAIAPEPSSSRLTSFEPAPQEVRESHVTGAGSVDYSLPSSDDTLIGTSKQPDFSFTAGTLSPSTIQPGGTTSFSFDLFTRCPAAYPSTVGVFLADANYQLLSYIGGVSIGAGAGTFSLPPTSITFSPYIAPGPYKLVLIADVDGVIAESNEDNNSGAFALNIVQYALTAFDRDESPLTPDVPVPAEAASMRNTPGLDMADGYLQKF